MDAKSRDLALLATLSLFRAVFAWGGGSRCFWLGLFCARCSRDSRCGLYAAALTWARHLAKPLALRFDGGGRCPKNPLTCVCLRLSSLAFLTR
jgi:hypothetical protein